MPGIFDDLIPAQAAPSASVGAFEDLVPPSPSASAQPGLPVPDLVISPSKRIDAAAAAAGVDPNASFEDKAKAIRAATHGKQQQIEGAANAADNPGSSAILAGAGNVVAGVPVAGPVLQSLLQKGVAGVSSAATGDPYADTLARIQGAQGEADAEHPLAKTAGQVGGAVLSAIPAAGTALGARAFGLVGGPLERFASGAAGGALIGGADAAVRGDAPVGGALAGGAVGAVAPFIGQAAGKIAGAVGNAVSPIFSGPLADVGRLGQKMLGNAVRDETPASIAAGQARVGPAGFLGDLTTPLTDVAGSIADQPGAGKAVIRDAYQARDTADRGRITQAITDAFGPPVNIADLTRSEQAARSASANPLYTAWRSTSVPMTPDLQTILQNVQNFRPQAFTAAQRLAAGEGQSITDQQGRVTAMGWDYLKRAMSDAADAAGYRTNEGRVASGIARHIVDAIDNHPSPTVAGVWRQARQAWADPTSILNAREAGQQVFSRAQRADELAYDVQGMSGPERTAFVQGARDQVQQIMDASRRGDTNARNLLLAPASQDKLRLILGQQRADGLAATLDQEVALKAQIGNVSGNSQTTPKKERIALTSPPPPDTGVPGYVRNLHIDQPASWVPGLSHWLNDFQTARYGAARGQIAPILTTAGPQRDMLINELMRGSQRAAGRSQTATNIGDLATILMNSAGGQEARRRIAPQKLQLSR